MANVERYFFNKLSRVQISIIQRIKLFSTVVGDTGVKFTVTGMFQNLCLFSAYTELASRI